MILHHNRSILYPERAINDKDRPKILFSSDIPYKIATCVAELHLFQGGTSSRLVDLSNYIQHFDITLELNALLLRNKQLTPSELVKSNQIFVAKSSSSANDSTFDRSISGFSTVWKSILATRKKDEIFVVTFRLYLSELSLDLAQVDNVKITFDMHNDANTLLAADPDLVEHLKGYIHQKLLHELKSNSDISIHITDSSTILQDSPINEYNAKFRDLRPPTEAEESDISNASLDESDTSLIIEKQLVFASEEDFDDSGEDIKILHSDDSSKCTVNEDDESDTLTNHDLEDLLSNEYSKQSPCGKASASTLDILGSLHETPSTVDSYQKIDALAPSPSLNITDSAVEQSPNLDGKLTVENDNEKTPFINEIENMRHNCFNLTLNEEKGDNSRKTEEFSNIHTDNKLSSKDDFDLHDEALDYMDDSISIASSPKKSSVVASPTKSNADEAPLRKKASVSFIDHDDAHGLKYAFKDSSVPEYIKENKKFKFIKIGKVQKFVNMFEEKMDSPKEPHTSRHGSRPASPMKIA